MIQALNAYYFKPIQSGDLDLGGDTALVKRLSKVDKKQFFNPIYNLKHPLSPHEAAQKEDINIHLDKINLPERPDHKPIIVEGAGGVMVPINDKEYIIDVIKKINLPVILVTRSQLGTLNHTILTVNALRSYKIDIAAIIMSGPSMPNNYYSLKKFTQVKNIFCNQWS